MSCHPENPGSTHHLACPCRESALAARIEELSRALVLICDTSEKNADRCIVEMKRIAVEALDKGKGKP